MARVLVAGCGDLGSGVAAQLVANTHRVFAIRRSGTEFPSGVQGITGDLTAMPDAALPDVDLIYLIMTPSGRTEAAYKAAYFETAQRLVQRYQSAAVRPKIVFVSSTSVYGQNQGEWIDEEVVPLPQSATAQTLYQAELLLKKAMSASAVRFSGIYGPGRNRLIDQVASAQPLSHNSWTNRIHRDDCVGFLVHLGEQCLAGDSLAPHYIATDSTPVSQWEVKLWLASRLGVELVFESSLSLKDVTPKQGKRLSNRRLCQTGYALQYPSYVTGYESLLRNYGKKLM